jgi:hypothetical protein
VAGVRMDRDRAVRAVFGDTPPSAQRHRLEVVVTGQDGIVESSDHAIACTACEPDCEESYAPGRR